MTDGTSPSVNSSLVIGNPGSNRVEFWQAALERQGLPASRFVSWRDAIAGECDIASQIAAGDIVRIESPGRDYGVERQLLQLGAGSVESPVALADVEDRGSILGPRQWYAGFCHVLETIGRQLAACPPHTVMNPPEDIAVMFDKRRCHRRLSEAGVPVPKSLGSVSSYNDLLARMRDTRIQRVFVKLAHGSSGSGVVAFEVGEGRMQATTTVELALRTPSDPDRPVSLYNSRRIRKYTDPGQSAAIIDRLCEEGVHVEQWVPKAGMDSSAFDVRVVVISGEPSHVVGRLSRTPITNLHLLNRRASAEAVRTHVGESGWKLILDAARGAARCFPRSLTAGIDVAVTPGFDRAMVLEVNAFGDLLPGIAATEGRFRGVDTYEAEVMAIRAGSAVHA